MFIPQPVSQSQINSLASGLRADKQLKNIKELAKNKAGKADKFQGQENQLKAVAKEFTALFLGQMYKAMEKTVPTGEIGFGGSAERIFREMANEEYAKEIASSPNHGLVDLVYKSISRRGYLKRPVNNSTLPKEAKND